MVGIAVSALTVEYPAADGYIVRALNGLDLVADDGEFVLLLGPSGSGKTTLLSCLAGILTPTSGRIDVAGVDVTALRGAGLNAYRRHSVGVVFQGFNLIDSLSALENVAVPLRMVGGRRADARAAAMSLLERVGLADRAQHRPGQLSGGQQQRVAIARAMALQPPVLLADEPTAHLDHVQVEGVISLLRGLAAPGRVVLVSTHDDRLVPLADRVVELQPRLVSTHSSPGEVRLAAGEVLFEQGSPSDLVYVVIDGEVELYRRSTDAAEQPLTRLGPGQHFGEMGPMLGLPRSASARATTATTLAAHTVTEFRNLAGVAERRRWRAATPAATPAQPTGEHARRSNNTLEAEADLRAVLQAYQTGDWETVHGYLPEDILLVDEAAGVTVHGADACVRFLRDGQERVRTQRPELVELVVHDGDLRALVQLLPVDGARGPTETTPRWCVDVTVDAHGFVRELHVQRVDATVRVPRQDGWSSVSAGPAATS